MIQDKIDSHAESLGGEVKLKKEERSFFGGRDFFRVAFL
jgi:hypothetical protein